jgi:hypothetical protein
VTVKKKIAYTVDETRKFIAVERDVPDSVVLHILTNDIRSSVLMKQTNAYWILKRNGRTQKLQFHYVPLDLMMNQLKSKAN